MSVQASPRHQGAHIVTGTESSQARAMRLLKALYDQSKIASYPVFVADLAKVAELTKQEAQRARNYLKDK
jgi:hypothetical protein